MIKRNLAAATVAGVSLVILSGPLALAHTEHRPDPAACDVGTARYGHHDDNTKPHPSGTTYDQARAVGGTEFYNRSGHYILRGDNYYVEVVGGGGYGDPGVGNQGGYAQGEVDHPAAPADADFHANAFAPTTPNAVTKPNAARGAACVNVADNRVGDPGSVPPSNS